MAIVDEDVERVRSAVPLVDVVQQYVALRRVGRRWVGLCPFHAERTGSFNVNEELGFYKCFGCGVSGDVITFVREIEHVDFVGAVELLAAKAGIQLRYTSGVEGRDRQRRNRLVEAMNTAVAWYHERLLESSDARAARDYLRSRGITGDVARRFQLGWAPDEWDALVRGAGIGADLLRDTGLAFSNRRDRLQDSFRARLLFPIFSETGDPVAFGGRVLPGSTDPAKYKNSPETAIYQKSKTLYGLNWAKTDVVASDQVIVCEGYTDVIGFHRAGIPRAVATCGTALTEEHFRLMKRFASRVVLAFDADEAGQVAAERFYEWERRYDVAVSVARLPAGTDPADLAARDPAALRAAVDDAVPFLGFRVERALRGPVRTPEQRARVAEAAMVVVNEHPDVNVRRIYAGEVAAHCGLPAGDLVALTSDERRRRPMQVTAPAPVASRGDNGEVVALALLIHRWDDIAEALVPALFADDVHLGAFRAMAEANGDVWKAMEVAEPEGRELLERLVALGPPDNDPDAEARNLIAAATRREVHRLTADARGMTSPEELRSVNTDVSDAKRLLEELFDARKGPAAADQLLTWLDRRTEERA